MLNRTRMIINKEEILRILNRDIHGQIKDIELIDVSMAKDDNSIIEIDFISEIENR